MTALSTTTAPDNVSHNLTGAWASSPVLGLDIGGTKLAVGMVTASGQVHGLQIQPTQREEGPYAVINRLFAMAHLAIESAGIGAPAAVGISCGGPLDPTTGIILSPPHLPGWDSIPLGPLAAEEFGIPFALHNDATAAALGEYRHGAGQRTRTMLYLTVSTGIGGGAVVDGRLMHGAAGNGGEFGHILVRPGGRRCSCGRRGCLEAYCSGTSIAMRAREALANELCECVLTDTATAADVAAAVRLGDPIATAVWDETVDLLACGLTDLVNAFEPDMIVLGGGVTRSGDLLLQPLRQRVAHEAMRPAASAVSIELAALGDVVGVVGAGALATDLLTHLKENNRDH